MISLLASQGAFRNSIDHFYNLNLRALPNYSLTFEIQSINTPFTTLREIDLFVILFPFHLPSPVLNHIPSLEPHMKQPSIPALQNLMVTDLYPKTKQIIAERQPFEDTLKVIYQRQESL